MRAKVASPFNRVITTVHIEAPKASALRVAGAALAIWIACSACARAADFLDRNARFDIAAAPLSTALLQFSSQSGVQVAVADADVAPLRSKAITGEYSIRDALNNLLRDTGLSFSPVGTAMVAIRAASHGPGNERSRAAPAEAGSATPTEPPPPALGSGADGPTQLPDIAVIAPRPPTAEELAGNSLWKFIVHHGTTHYSEAAGSIFGGLLRWRGGRAETICPETVGLDQGYNDFVSARLRAVASFVGAPVQPDLRCEPNVKIIFTTEPRKWMAAILEWGAHRLGVGFPHQEQKELQISDAHAIQGWYLTTGGGAGVLNRDARLAGGGALQSLWPRVIPTSVYAGGGGSILSVVLVIDTNKVAGATIGSIADYLALVALTVAQSPNHCDPLPSILDLMSPACGSRDKPLGLTAGDLAFLKALYYENTGIGKTLSRDEIQYNMMRQFRGG
jgi:hypothetical protein